jgi:putative inorganic carbon (HCO3(-)) transporter
MRQRERHGDRWIFGLLLVLLFWLPLPWGSKPAAASAFFGLATAGLVVARLVIAWRGDVLPALPPAARLALGLWMAWLGWCGLLMLPLPETVVAFLSPHAHALHLAVDAVPGGSAQHSLSIAPGASARQFILGANYLALFWLVLVIVARQRSRQRLVLGTLVLSGLAQALYGSVMTLSGLEYGFLEPKSVGHGWATGTFVNRNHLAGYLELTLSAGIALVLADLRSGTPQTWRQRLAGLVDLLLSPRMRVRVLLALMVVALVLTRSRMGNVAFFIALAICGNLYILLRHPKYLLRSFLFFASLVLVDLLIVSEHYGLEKVVQRIESTDLRTEQRTLVFRDLVPVIQQYGLVGAGPGSFPDAFAPHRSQDIAFHYDHAHNDYAEFLIETGVVGCALLGALAFTTWWHALRVLRRRRDPAAAAIAFAGAMGLLALAIHSLVDFNLHIPAVAATLVTLMALTLSVSSRSAQEAPA